MTNYASLLSELITAIDGYRAAETKNWMERNQATTKLKATIDLCQKALNEHDQEPNTTN